MATRVARTIEETIDRRAAESIRVWCNYYAEATKGQGPTEHGMINCCQKYIGRELSADEILYVQQIFAKLT